MKISNYVQHYALRRIRRPNGRYEPVKPRHAWSAAYKFSNWLYYNMQRHADHHVSNRRYPLLQHHGETASPQLPGSYNQMNGLALFPQRWFAVMDPLVDHQRAQFYPDIDDWSAYDSRAFAARADHFDVIAEIHAAAPRLAGWINDSPALLDTLREREFTDLELPEGIGDPEFEMIARSGLARLYWTHELDLSEMRAQLADVPVQDAGEAVEAALEWTNGKVFQIGVHAMRGSLSVAEMGTALSRVGEASIAHVLSAAEDDFADRGTRRATGGMAVVLLGPLAGGEALPGTRLDVRFVYEGGPAKSYEALCRRVRKALRALTRDNLLLAPVARDDIGGPLTLAAFAEQVQAADSGAELLALARARCVFVVGDRGIEEKVARSLRDGLGGDAARERLLAEVREGDARALESDLASVADMRGGLGDIERAALSLRLTLGGAEGDLANGDAASVFRAAGRRGLIAEDAAERLAEAATLWRNLHGSTRLVSGDGFAADAVPPAAGAVVADACGADDLGALAATVRDTASRTAADIDALARGA